MKPKLKLSVIIIGPAGCGKTRYSEALRNYYGLERIIDDAHHHTKVPQTGALVLTPVPLQAPPGVRTIKFEDAAKAAFMHL